MLNGKRLGKLVARKKKENVFLFYLPRRAFHSKSSSNSQVNCSSIKKQTFSCAAYPLVNQSRGAGSQPPYCTPKNEVSVSTNSPQS